MLLIKICCSKRGQKNHFEAVCFRVSVGGRKAVCAGKRWSISRRKSFYRIHLQETKRNEGQRHHSPAHSVWVTGVTGELWKMRCRKKTANIKDCLFFFRVMRQTPATDRCLSTILRISFFSCYSFNFEKQKQFFLFENTPAQLRS